MKYEDIHDWDNLCAAWHQAAAGKRGGWAVASFEHRLEHQLLELQDELAACRWRPGPYHSFVIHEPKRRLISAAPFRDRVVHHALCNVIGPPLERGFIANTYANQIGKGTHRALNAAHRMLGAHRYVLSCDIRQFFPAMDHRVLEELLFRHITDGQLQAMVRAILASGAGILAGEYSQDWFPGDDLLAALRPRGLPIGNLTSQFWANCYLTPLDHFVTRELGCAAYVRYVDDFLLCANDLATLHRWRRQIVERLERYRLRIHAGSHPRPATEGVPFLGFILFPTHRRLKARKGWHFVRLYHALRKDAAAGRVDWSHVTAVVEGWVNHVRHGDTVGLRRAILENPKFFSVGVPPTPPEVREPEGAC